MNRFEYTETSLLPGEYVVAKDRNVRLYDGDQKVCNKSNFFIIETKFCVKTNFEGGEIIITSHRLFWGRPGAFDMQQICMAIPLKLVYHVYEEHQGAFSFSRSRKLIFHLHPPLPGNNICTEVVNLKV